MSRHVLQPRADRPDVAEAAIGWDRPLATFFFQAFAPQVDGEDHIIEWCGTEPGELPTPEAAIEALGPDQHRRLIQAGQALVQQRRAFRGLDLRLDIIAFAPGHLPRHIRGLIV